MERRLSKIVRTYYREAMDRARTLPLEDAVLVCVEVVHALNMLSALYPSDAEFLVSYERGIWDCVYDSCDARVQACKKEIEAMDAGLYDVS